ncbi:MAG TPA: hypothetical protein DCG30_06800 [Ruminococcus sp.]|nr:hypothetical protein [Ruminococcus sp.]
MTAETLTQKNKTGGKSFMWKRFFNSISDNKRMLIVNIVLELIGLPVLTLCGLIEEYQSINHVYDRIDIDVYMVVSVISIGICLFMGMIIALYHFRYLYSKQLVDMNYSLPLSTRERFTADYLSGLFVYLVPAIGAVILSIIILAIGSSSIGGSDIWDVFPDLLKIVSVVIIAMIIYYTLSILSITFCGSRFEAGFSVIAVNVMIPTTIACLWFAIVSTAGFGLDEEAILYNPIFNTTSPAGAAAFTIGYIDDFYDEEAPANAYIRWVIMSLITIAIYLFASYFLYKFRKAEDVSKPYVYKAFFYFIMTCAVFCILSLFIINDDDDFFGGILICAIGWFIMEVITRRGFKRFWTAGLGFCAAVGGVLAICGICKATDGFGASKHIPANMNISSVSIESYDLLPVQYDDISFRDKDVINAVTALNKEIIDRHYNSENYQYRVAANTPEQNSLSSIYDCQHISITYKTRTGSTVMREYSCASGIAGDLVQAIILSDEYAEYVSKELKLTSFNDINNDIYYRSIEEADKRATVDKLPISYSLPCGMHLQRKTIERDKLIEIADAYEKDLKELTAEDLKASREVAEIYGYWVLECFDDTIAKMNEYGLEIAEIDSDKNANDLSNIAIIPNPVFYSSEINIYSTSSGRYYGHLSGHDFTLPDKITAANWQYSYDTFNSYSELHPIQSYDAAEDIVSISTPVIVGEYPLAIIWTGSNNCYYVTDHGNNKEILDKAMKELYR